MYIHLGIKSPRNDSCGLLRHDYLVGAGAVDSR